MTFENLLNKPKFNLETLTTHEHDGKDYIKVSDFAVFISGHAQTIVRQIKKENESYVKNISALNGNCIEVSVFEDAIKNQPYNLKSLLSIIEESKERAKSIIIDNSNVLILKTEYDNLLEYKRDSILKQNEINSLETQIGKMFFEIEVTEKIKDACSKISTLLANENDAAINKLRNRYDGQVGDLFSKATLDLKVIEAADRQKRELDKKHKDDLVRIKAINDKFINDLELKYNQKVAFMKNNEDANSKDKVYKDGLLVSKHNESINELKVENKKATDLILLELEKLKVEYGTLEDDFQKKDSDLLDNQLSNTTQSKNFLSRVATDPIFQSIYLCMVIFGTITIGYFELYSSFTGQTNQHWTSGTALVIVSICLGMALVWTAYNVQDGIWKNIAMTIFAMCEWSSFSSFIQLELAYPDGLASFINAAKLTAFSLLLPVLTVLLSKSGESKKSLIEISDSLDDLIKTLADNKVISSNVLINYYKKLIVIRSEKNNISPIFEFYKRIRVVLKDWWK